jgi:hypothetical protein
MDSTDLEILAALLRDEEWRIDSLCLGTLSAHGRGKWRSKRRLMVALSELTVVVCVWSGKVCTTTVHRKDTLTLVTLMDMALT